MPGAGARRAWRPSRQVEQVSLAGHGVEITLIRSTICTLAAARRAQGARQSNEAASRRGREWEAANSERPSKSEILLARIAVALLIGFAVAGILWYGLSTDELQRLWRNIAARPGGPMTFRFVLQPTMAALAAWRDGVTDARLYRLPYLSAILLGDERRGARLWEGVVSTGRILILGVVVDVAYQLAFLDSFFPGESAIIAILLAFLPYALLRGPIARLARRRTARPNSAEPTFPGRER